MKARPILFNGEMIQAILDGRKTQTRRPVAANIAANFDEPRGPSDVAAGYPFIELETGFVSAREVCPIGQHGDLLWCRETFSLVPQTAYRCSVGVPQTVCPDDPDRASIYRAGWCRSEGGIVWRPSIHMPRWASRLTLEITDVRVERVQQITHSDAVAEGCDVSRLAAAATAGWYERPQRAFRRVWDAVYGSWEANPWVWVVEFKPLRMNVDVLLKKGAPCQSE